MWVLYLRRTSDGGESPVAWEESKEGLIKFVEDEWDGAGFREAGPLFGYDPPDAFSFRYMGTLEDGISALKRQWQDFRSKIPRVPSDSVVPRL